MKAFITLLFLIFSLQNFAQNISGQAYYQSKNALDFDVSDTKSQLSEDVKKTILDGMKSMLENTFILTFNKEESIYREEEKLDANPAYAGMKMMMGSFMPGPMYKNLKTGKMLEENEFFGKQFLVTDTIQKLDWKLEKESKQIGQYVVFKATAIKKIDPNDFLMARPKKKDSSANEAKDEKEKNADNKKNEIPDPMDMIEIPEEIEITAWYTPQIPVSNGPGEYGGLPGLIMELSFYKTTILCSKIVMNPKAAEKIEAPKKGKEVSREEYTKIVKEKTEELRENFRNMGGRRGSGF
ncbi:GLPGLI family protein [Aequorivita sp. H23M31]|uniref:GLPGLI family protein n=1 Tax=Aequorivita ciconiae TaxID=2494375 RepID=A0A410G325_9FLAO|nr:GLPGLI family protein [Aequorivita sp. H23M31]QAA81688.1 GLPGLI family protein [Aequorivita sp. H23M31]